MKWTPDVENALMSQFFAGMTLTALSEQYGVCAETIRQRIRKIQNKANILRDDELAGLSPRSRNALKAYGLYEREQVRLAFLAGKRIVNLGDKCKSEVMEWLGV